MTDISKVRVDRMDEGFLVRDVDTELEALEAIEWHHGTLIERGDCEIVPDTYRKVPGQWCSWRLHTATPGARGSFEAFVVYTDGRHRWAKETP